MSQNDMSLANAAGATFRADVNSALQALASNSSGTTEPSTTYAYQFWADTTTGLLKIRNAANNAWITIGTLASTNLALVPQTFSSSLLIKASTSDGSDNLVLQLAAGGNAVNTQGAFLTLSGNESGSPGQVSLNTGDVSGAWLNLVSGTSYLRIDRNAGAYFNDTANANNTAGVTINQGAADDEIESWKSSDVSHGATSVTEADTFGFISKGAAATGGVMLTGIHEGAQAGVIARGIMTTASSTRSTAARAAVEVNGGVISGSSMASLGANANIMAVQDNGTTRFILDSDGDSHQDVGTAWTNFDFTDDLRVMDALALVLNTQDDPVRAAFVGSLEESRTVIERLPGKPIVQFGDDGHHFANMSRVTMLHHGAIRQIGRQMAELSEQVAARLERIEQKLLAA